MKENVIVIDAISGPLVYEIMRRPSRYCCFCQIPLINEAAAKVHVIDRHPKAVSPDKQNPSGYRKSNFFACKRVTDLPKGSAPGTWKDFFTNMLPEGLKRG